MWIGRKGWRVTPVGSVAEARECLASLTFALVITDFTLPDGNGGDVLGFAHALEASPMTIVASGAPAALAQGADGRVADAYLSKPFDFKELDALLRVAASR